MLANEGQIEGPDECDGAASLRVLQTRTYGCPAHIFQDRNVRVRFAHLCVEPWHFVLENAHADCIGR